MCPVCLATTAWIAASIVTTGGVGAFVFKKVAAGKAANHFPANPKSEEDHHG
jgi:hypothetical protein